MYVYFCMLNYVARMLMMIPYSCPIPAVFVFFGGFSVPLQPTEYLFSFLSVFVGLVLPCEPCHFDFFFAMCLLCLPCAQVC